MVKSLSLGDIFEDMARVHLDHRPGTKAGRVIVISSGNKRIRALARGAPANSRNTIHLDQAMRDKLGVPLNKEVDFDIEGGRFWDEFLWAWNATNAMPRVAARLGVISVLLGAVGLILGIASWVKS
jgi:hypothetical protein